jgi:hypothetical protein
VAAVAAEVVEVAEVVAAAEEAAGAGLAAAVAGLAVQDAAFRGDPAACAKRNRFPDTLHTQDHAGRVRQTSTRPMHVLLKRDKGIAVVGEYALRLRAGKIGKAPVLVS